MELLCGLASNPRWKAFVPKFCFGTDVCEFGIFRETASDPRKPEFVPMFCPGIADGGNSVGLKLKLEIGSLGIIEFFCEAPSNPFVKEVVPAL